jgi:E3 ubiquitin-protein ligase makorin
VQIFSVVVLHLQRPLVAIKQEEVTAIYLSAKPSLAASSSVSFRVGQITEKNIGETESRNPNFPTVGAGSEDWVNVIELIPGQPYCGLCCLFLH